MKYRTNMKNTLILNDIHDAADFFFFKFYPNPKSSQAEPTHHPNLLLKKIKT